MPHWQGVFACTGFNWTMVQDHSRVVRGRGLGEVGEPSAAKMLLSVKNNLMAAPNYLANYIDYSNKFHFHYIIFICHHYGRTMK